jgi:hypothetical protein
VENLVRHENMVGLTVRNAMNLEGTTDHTGMIEFRVETDRIKQERRNAVTLEMSKTEIMNMTYLCKEATAVLAISGG